nr:transposase [Streptomyces carminius]
MCTGTARAGPRQDDLCEAGGKGLGGCGHVAKENRVTQARFQCTACGFTTNADHVGATNVLNRAGLALCAALASSCTVGGEASSC